MIECRQSLEVPLGYEAAKAVDANRSTSWRSGAATATLAIPFGGTRSIGRADIQFDNGTQPTAQSIAVTLEYQNPAGAWAPVWSGTAYSQVWSRTFTQVEATAIRLTTNAQGVGQLDVFSPLSATPTTSAPMTPPSARPKSKFPQ